MNEVLGFDVVRLARFVLWLALGFLLFLFLVLFFPFPFLLLSLLLLLLLLLLFCLFSLLVISGLAVGMVRIVKPGLVASGSSTDDVLRLAVSN